MKTVHLTNNDFDGAGRAVHTLHKALLSRGVESLMLVYRKKSHDPSVVQVCDGHPLKGFSNFRQNSFKSIPFLCHKAAWRIKELRWQPETIFNFNQPFVTLNRLKPYLSDVDVVCLYSVQSFLSSELIQEVHEYTQAPIAWTIMDIEPLSGGCHFNKGCRLFEKECGSCPQLKRSGPEDISRSSWLRKERGLTGLPIHFVAASNWVEGYIRRSSLFKSAPVQKILLSIDEEVFKPAAQEDVRRELDLPLDADIILFGCFDLLSGRKGGAFLLDALRSYASKHKNAMLITFGRNADAFVPADLSLSVKHFGPVHNDAVMARLFQAADVFACPTIDDFGPLVVVESFMCSTPVVAFNRGVAQDLIVDASSGVLVDELDARAYSAGLEQCLARKKQNISLSEKSKSLKQACTRDYQANAYYMFLDSLSETKKENQEKSSNKIYQKR